MTRGKYAARAATKRETAEVEQSEAAYRRQIVRLTEERNEARAERDKALTDWAKDVRVLRAQLTEATSPRTEALSRTLEELRQRYDHLLRESGQRSRDDAHMFAFLVNHFKTGHELGGLTAAEYVATFFRIGPKSVGDIDVAQTQHNRRGRAR